MESCNPGNSESAGAARPASAVLVAAAVIVEGDRVLLTQRKQGTHLEGAWEFPGGKVEPDEDPRDALARELREEIGIDAQAGDIVEATFHRYPTSCFRRPTSRCSRRCARGYSPAGDAAALLAVLCGTGRAPRGSDLKLGPPAAPGAATMPPSCFS